MSDKCQGNNLQGIGHNKEVNVAGIVPEKV